ncbi:hypothetical protein PCO31010_04121 [Pandoraea commovens]|uniref:Uncharacterized protein n=1 Tax=Pandoraea commovens TaxID=2508289 RepID=A0A5E4XVN9_9BURK|nr:hypothetical protein PCO31010_04121 [Pandoraea commovens]
MITREIALFPPPDYSPKKSINLSNLSYSAKLLHEDFKAAKRSSVQPIKSVDHGRNELSKITELKTSFIKFTNALAAISYVDYSSTSNVTHYLEKTIQYLHAVHREELNFQKPSKTTRTETSYQKTRHHKISKKLLRNYEKLINNYIEFDRKSQRQNLRTVFKEKINSHNEGLYALGELMANRFGLTIKTRLPTYEESSEHSCVANGMPPPIYTDIVRHFEPLHATTSDNLIHGCANALPSGNQNHSTSEPPPPYSP